MAVIIDCMFVPETCEKCFWRDMNYAELKSRCVLTREELPLYKAKRGDLCPLKEFRRGKWIPTKHENIFTCSECAHEFALIPSSAFNYCPNCGSSMEGEEE